MLFLTLLLSSCADGTTDCGKGGPYFNAYTIEEYELDFEVYQPAPNFDGEEPVSYEPPMAINPLDLVLLLGSDVSYARNRSLTFSLFPLAVACSPATFDVALQRVVDFRIISTASFGEDFPAGTDLEPLFIQVYRNGATPRTMSFYTEEPVTEEALPPRSSWYRLAAIPIDDTHIFTVTIELDDSSVYQFQSPEVTFDLEASSAQ